MMKRRPAAAFVFVACAAAACGVDQTKFERVYRAGKALQVEVNATGGASADAITLLKAFQVEIATLDGRVSGGRERVALQSYADASDAYEAFLRFRVLDYDAVEGRIFLMGTNLEAATSTNFQSKHAAKGNGWRAGWR